jgi:hypothetical protein
MTLHEQSSKDLKQQVADGSLSPKKEARAEAVLRHRRAEERASRRSVMNDIRVIRFPCVSPWFAKPRRCANICRRCELPRREPIWRSLK